MEDMYGNEEVIFIEYCPSRLIVYANLKLNMVFIPEVMRQAIDTKDSDYQVMCWTEEQIQLEFANVSLKNFSKACKLYLLKKLKENQKRVVIFTTRDVVKKVLPVLEQPDMPRSIVCKIYPLFDINRSIYYVSFNDKPSIGNDRALFVFENIFIFSRDTTLSYA
jgi:hypothetical protein